MACAKQTELLNSMNVYWQVYRALWIFKNSLICSMNFGGTLFVLKQVIWPWLVKNRSKCWQRFEKIQKPRRHQTAQSIHSVIVCVLFLFWVSPCVRQAHIRYASTAHMWNKTIALYVMNTSEHLLLLFQMLSFSLIE